MAMMENLDNSENTNFDVAEMTNLINENTDDFLKWMEGLDQIESIEESMQSALKWMFEDLGFNDQLKTGKTFEDVLNEVANREVKINTNAKKNQITFKSLKEMDDKHEEAVVLLCLFNQHLPKAISWDELAINRVRKAFTHLIATLWVGQKAEASRKILKAKIALWILENGGSSDTVSALFTEKDTVTPLESNATEALFIGRASKEELQNEIDHREKELAKIKY